MNFMLAYSPEEIVDEGQQQGNCVAGYVRSVSNGQSLIMFLRKDQKKSWVTIELREDKDGQLNMTQVYEPYNAILQDESKSVLNAWAKLKGIKIDKRIGGCQDTSNWENQYHKRYRKLDMLEDGEHTKKANKVLIEFNNNDGSDKKGAKVKLLKDTTSFKKAI